MKNSTTREAARGRVRLIEKVRRAVFTEGGEAILPPSGDSADGFTFGEVFSDGGAPVDLVEDVEFVLWTFREQVGGGFGVHFGEDGEGEEEQVTLRVGVDVEARSAEAAEGVGFSVEALDSEAVQVRGELFGDEAFGAAELEGDWAANPNFETSQFAGETGGDVVERRVGARDVGRGFYPLEAGIAPRHLTGPAFHFHDGQFAF